jgi:hypothetical protein
MKRRFKGRLDVGSESPSPGIEASFSERFDCGLKKNPQKSKKGIYKTIFLYYSFCNSILIDVFTLIRAFLMNHQTWLMASSTKLI